MNAWIAIPTNPDGPLSEAAILLGILLLFLAILLSLWGFTYGEERGGNWWYFGSIAAAAVGVMLFALSAFVLGQPFPGHDDTKTILTTEYGLPEDTATTLADDLFTNSEGRKSYNAQPGGAETTYTDPATNKTTEYRILTNGALMKLQSRTLPDTANGTADETEWTDMAPLTTSAR